MPARNFVSPEEIFDLPKASPKKTDKNQKKYRKGRTIITTSTPEKLKLEQQNAGKMAKEKNKKLPSKGGRYCKY